MKETCEKQENLFVKQLLVEDLLWEETPEKKSPASSAKPGKFTKPGG